MANTIEAQLITLFLGALAFVTALAWNSAVQSAFRTFYKSDTSTLEGQVLYALTVTLVTIVAGYMVLKIAGKSYDPRAKLF